MQRIDGSTDTIIRVYTQEEDGRWEDWQEEYGLENFGGFLPGPGDMILAPGVLQGRDRLDPANREMLTVVQRVFNPRDNDDYVALIVTRSVPSGRERTMVTAR